VNPHRSLLLLLFTFGVLQPRPVHCQVGASLFSDDFEGDLAGWVISNLGAISIVDSNQDAHGMVLRMVPYGEGIHALIPGSEEWGSYRVQAEVFFPEDVHNYFGFIYNYTQREGRTDFGSIYLKGNGSYVRVNPRRDLNPARALYEELRAPVAGSDSVRIGEWVPVAAEVRGNVCHFFVGDMGIPKVTFDFFEIDVGMAGIKPRVAGGEVWVDNVRVTTIDTFSYHGPPRPLGVRYRPEELVTDWSVLGPLRSAALSVEASPIPGEVVVDEAGRTHQWRQFQTDPRGAVLTGLVTDFLGDRTVAYFTTRIQVEAGERAVLQFFNVDDLVLWRNGRFVGYLNRDMMAWHDFGSNPDHPPTRGEVLLEEGENHILLRVRGGQYATGGFFARVVSIPEASDHISISRSSRSLAPRDLETPLDRTRKCGFDGYMPARPRCNR